MFDTHAHVHDAAFDGDRAAMLERARAAGVDRILTVGTDLETSRAARRVALEFGLAYSAGVHPHEAKDAPPALADALAALAGEDALAPRAIGEIGLDYYYDHSPRDVQVAVLTTQLRFARENGMPVIFHQRDAFDDFLAVLRAEWTPAMRGVVHCFTGTATEAELLVGEFGLRLGIGGVLTFKSAEPLREAVRTVGLAPLILETDAPYLAPVPHRGQRNEPAFMPAVADLLAELLGTDADSIEAATTATATALFGG